jgi:protoporphyrinogen oxidase
MLDRPRSSRIFYRGKFFSYPLKAAEALFKLGVIESALCMLSYGKAQAMPVENPKNFEDWVSNKFGNACFRFSSKPTPKKFGE